MTFGIYFLVDLTNRALRIDHESSALPELHAFPFGLAKTESLHERGVGVGQQFNCEGEFGAEVFVRGGIVGADAHKLDACRVKVGLAGREGFALDGAAGRVVLRIEVDHEPVAGEIGKLGGLAVLVGQREIGEGISGLCCQECVVLSICWYVVSTFCVYGSVLGTEKDIRR